MTQTRANIPTPPLANGLTPAPRRRPGSAIAARLPQETRRVLPVLAPTVVAGTVMTAAAAWSFADGAPDAGVLAGVLALLVACAIAEAFPVPLEGVTAGRTSLATVFVAATAALYGWAPATLVAVLTMALVELKDRKPPSRVAYNTALYALSAAAAGGAAGLLDDTGLAALALRTVLAACAFYLVNICLLAAVVARVSGQGWPRLLGRYLYTTVVPFSIMASVTVILVALWDRSPFLALALVGPLTALVLYERWLHRAFERLRELDTLKDEFIAVVSHELRTPLASVYGAAMTLQRRQLDEESRDSMLAIIYRESARLARLVDQVLWASRLESGRVAVAVGSLDAAQLARELVDATRARLPQGLSIELSVDAATPPVAGDVDTVKQVLANLVENAVKYSPDGGQIEVRLEQSNGFVRFSVRDEGLGIPGVEQRRIFEKFHRLDPNQTRGVSGTGLGLYICSELVRRMNGRIWVASEPGAGSTFSFELPRADPAV
jgi:signal transduction histidine kinase